MNLFSRTITVTGEYGNTSTPVFMQWNAMMQKADDKNNKFHETANYEDHSHMCKDEQNINKWRRFICHECVQL